MELRRRCRTWPRDGPGRRRQRTKGGFRTKREAEQVLATVIRTLGEGTYVARDPQTLEEWIKRWLVTIALRSGRRRWGTPRTGWAGCPTVLVRCR
jgi:phosphoribosylformimino-5-aminoimidazole carboxamide ribonucleotide (ProFAR) isomerase